MSYSEKEFLLPAYSLKLFSFDEECFVYCPMSNNPIFELLLKSSDGSFSTFAE